MKIYANQQQNSNSVKFSAHNSRRDTFTFLKSNYKYKRRYLEPRLWQTASQCRCNAIRKIIATDNDSATGTECNSINKVIKETRTSWKGNTTAHIFYESIHVLRMLLLIMSNSKKQRSNDNVGGKQHITKGNEIQGNNNNGNNVLDKQLTTSTRDHNVEGEIASTTFFSSTFTFTSNDDVNADNDKMNFQQNDVKVLTATKTTASSPRSTKSSTSSTSSLSISSASSMGSFVLPTTTLCSSSTTTATKSVLSSSVLPFATYHSAIRISDRLFTFLAALFIAFAFCARTVAAGACWQSALDNGKCSEIYSLNITKAECCGRSQEFSYTEHNPTEVEYFFATAIGGGMECTPCIESCKNIECEVNKKCVKRKGRPKCICAPECGAAARRHRQKQQKQQKLQLQQQHFRGHLHHSEQLPRDIRSLSSEITNFNLGLDTRGDVDASNRNQNQRKMLILQSQRYHHNYNHQHHHHHYHQQEQQQQQHQQQQQQQIQQIQLDENSPQEKATKRLVIIANVDPNDNREHSTTRRVQVISNVVKDHRDRYVEGTSPSSGSSSLLPSSSSPSSSSSSSLSSLSAMTTNTWSSGSETDDKVRRPLMSRLKSKVNNQHDSKLLLLNEMPMHQKNNKTRSNNCNDDINTDQLSNNDCNRDNPRWDNRQRTDDKIGRNHNRTEYSPFVDDGDTVDFHDDALDSGQHREQQRRKLNRHRKQHRKQQHCCLHHRHHQHHHHDEHQHPHQHQHYRQHRHHSKQQKKQKLQLERQQQKQNRKDQRREQHKVLLESNKTTMIKQTLLPNGATLFVPSSVPSSSPSPSPSLSPSLSSLSSPSTATTKTTTTTSTQFIQSGKPQASTTIQTDTFSNSATSLLSATGHVVTTDHQHYLNRGSISATSSSQTSSGQQTSSSESIATTATATAKADKVPDRIVVGVASNFPSTLSFQADDDLELFDGIHENIDLHGLSNNNDENSDFEIIHHNTHPVCGTDGRTYNSECQLKKRACRTNNQNLQVAYRGHCKTSCNGVTCLNGLTCVEDHYMTPHCIACKITCPDDDELPMDDSNFKTTSQKIPNRRIVIDPSRAVCGVDGKTYKSICDINRMICKIGRSIAVAYPGPCRTDRITCDDINCGPKHKCLVDLLTHEPRCVSCRYKCSRKRHPTALRYVEGKICGVNNRTYNSWCEMRKDSCTTGFFIDVKAAGQCQ